VVSGTPDEVLDGDLDEFMEAALAQRVEGGGPTHVEDVD
jgi:peptide chain release factor 2